MTTPPEEKRCSKCGAKMLGPTEEHPGYLCIDCLNKDLFGDSSMTPDPAPPSQEALRVEEIRKRISHAQKESFEWEKAYEQDCEWLLSQLQAKEDECQRLREDVARLNDLIKEMIRRVNKP